MTPEYDMEKLESLDRKWTDQFASKRGWEHHHLTDPAETLEIFFNNIPGTSMLDAGCGWGRYAHRFIEAELDYIGIDLSSEMLSVAKTQNPGLTFLQGTFRRLPFPDEQFDGIWSCCSLGATPKTYISSVLEEHRRVLKPGGIMMIILPSALISDEGLHRDEESGLDVFQALYICREFLDYVEQAQFSVVECEDDPYLNGAMSILIKK